MKDDGDPLVRARYIALLRELDLLYPDPDGNGERNGQVDVNAMCQAIRRAWADCPALSAEYGSLDLIYANVVLLESACDLAEALAMVQEDWSVAKPLLNRHHGAQVQACTVLGAFIEHLLQASGEGVVPVNAPGSLRIDANPEGS